MVFPAATDFQVAARKTLSDEAALSHQSKGGLVYWLNIGFYAVEFQFAESVHEHELHALAHQALPRMGQKTVIPKKGAVEATTNQVVHIDDPDEIAGVPVNDQKAPMGFRDGVFRIAGKGLWGGGR